MRQHRCLLEVLCVCIASLGATAAPALASPGFWLQGVESGRPAEFRPPAVPLVTFDPFLSIWSEADHLTDDVTRHWTGHPQSLISLIRVDGQCYRLMGRSPDSVDPMPQTGLTVLPTRTIYRFGNPQIQVVLTFETALLPDDLNVMSRPLSYITWSVRSADGASHRVSLYMSASSEMAVNTPDETVELRRQAFGPLTALSAGTEKQPVLGSRGDDMRIDWGYAYLVAAQREAATGLGDGDALLTSFVRSGHVPATGGRTDARPVTDGDPTLALTFDLGEVGGSQVARRAMVGYDEIYAIDYFGQRIRPYWRRNGATPSTMFQAADLDYARVSQRCAEFDREMMADLAREGGRAYAQIAALAYRQCFSACGLAADRSGQPLFFTKENTSNGDIATVDVIFPMDPVWILLSPTLAKASLVPDLDYASSGRWRFPSAPHDLGTYPIAFGRDDGGEGMPVEESGNLLILCDAIAHADGNAGFVTKWWPTLSRWAQYLQQYGLDPEDQLCTDDFMGHLAHNANLSIKAILGLAAYGDLCGMRSDTAGAARYHAEAVADARHWVQVAEQGDHSLLAFDKPNTWSQKYNLVWDRILGLNVFPAFVAQREVAWYKQRLEPYGLPLDSRTKLTKTDWTTWSATLATSRADFETLIAPLYRYLSSTSSRVPLVDSYVTTDPASSGMHARPVVGGVFIKMLADPLMWHKWASRGRQSAGPWAPFPRRPLLTTVVPTGRRATAIWRYTIEQPPAGWERTRFDDSSWQQGPGGFGSFDFLHTPWHSDDIWIRRRVTLPAGRYTNLEFQVFHDEDVQIYIDGVPASQAPGYITDYEELPIRPAARALLKPGATVTIAAHCHQTVGGQGIDIGLVNVTPR